MTTRQWRVAIGADDAGYEYKETIAADLAEDDRVASVTDHGVSAGESIAYPNVALRVAEAVARGDADRGVLICGTGIGMAITANKVPGVRATPVADSFSAERSILSNDCQIITFGQRVIGVELARRLVKEWLGYVFDPQSPSNEKVAVITAYEERNGS